MTTAGLYGDASRDGAGSPLATGSEESGGANGATTDFGSLASGASVIRKGSHCRVVGRCNLNHRMMTTTATVHQINQVFARNAAMRSSFKILRCRIGRFGSTTQHTN
jgi:hypothetical protein